MEGPAPPAGAVMTAEWYLRVDLRTAAGRGRIHVRAGDCVAELSTGDVATAIVGPLRQLPDGVTVRLDSSELDRRLDQLVAGFADAAADLADTAADLVLSVRGGHPDLAGAATRVWLPADLARIGTEPVAFTDAVGEHRLTGTIRAAGPAYQVRLDELTPGDDVLVLAGLVDLAARDPRRRIQVTQTGRGHDFGPVLVPQGYGALALPVAVYRHRDDTAESRAELLAAFRRSAEVETRSWCDQVAEAVAELAGPVWRLGAIEVQAFATAGPSVATVAVAEPDRWFAPGDAVDVPLDPAPQWRDPTGPSAQRNIR